MDFTRIDELAVCGYQYAAGSGVVPKLLDQLDIDSFNAGIMNYNSKNGAHVSRLFERTTYIRDGANGRTADKELAIVGAGTCSAI